MANRVSRPSGLPALPGWRPTSLVRRGSLASGERVACLVFHEHRNERPHAAVIEAVREAATVSGSNSYPSSGFHAINASWQRRTHSDSRSKGPTAVKTHQHARSEAERAVATDRQTLPELTDKAKTATTIAAQRKGAQRASCRVPRRHTQRATRDCSPQIGGLGCPGRSRLAYFGTETRSRRVITVCRVMSTRYPQEVPGL